MRRLAIAAFIFAITTTPQAPCTLAINAADYLLESTTICIGIVKDSRNKDGKILWENGKLTDDLHNYISYSKVKDAAAGQLILTTIIDRGQAQFRIDKTITAKQFKNHVNQSKRLITSEWRDFR